MATKKPEPPLTDDELIALRVKLKEDFFAEELRNRLGSGLVVAERITTSLIKLAIAIGVMYAWGIDFLRHILGIQK